MEKQVLGFCPVCEKRLLATKLYCKTCDLELSGDFSLNEFSYLSKEELHFVNIFLANEGSFKDVQNELDITYQKAKQQLADILLKLGLRNSEDYKEEEVENLYLTNIPIKDNDHFITKLIKVKLNGYNGKATIPLINEGKTLDIRLAEDGQGLVSSRIPKSQLGWKSFISAYEIITAQDGEAYKGYARAGKLGSEKLPLTSIEGYVASNAHGIKEGESAFSPGFAITAILDWVGIVKNERGSLIKIVEKAVCISNYEEALINARTFIKELDSSPQVINKLGLFRHWYYFDEIDGFAPSKFIGYKNMNMKAYEIAASINLDGKETEHSLTKLFRLAENNRKIELINKLEQYLNAYGKKLNSLVEIHIR